jgi:hypothetical protein
VFFVLGGRALLAPQSVFDAAGNVVMLALRVLGWRKTGPAQTIDRTARVTG